MKNDLLNQLQTINFTLTYIEAQTLIKFLNQNIDKIPAKSLLNNVLVYLEEKTFK